MSQLPTGVWTCRECGSAFHGGGLPIHDRSCSLYRHSLSPTEGLFGPYDGCDYLELDEWKRQREERADSLCSRDRRGSGAVEE